MKYRSVIPVSALVLLMATSFSCEKECVTPVACSLEPETGPCKAYFIRYYYDKKEEKCKEFVWGGCDGTVPFETLEECQACLCSD